MKTPPITYPCVFIQPHCDACSVNITDGPQWCQDDVWDPCEGCGATSTKYVLSAPPEKDAT